MKAKTHIAHLDTARALSMLWIIGIWHLSASIFNFPSLKAPCWNYLTTISLATFTFLSGFFLSQYATITRWSDTWAFYKRRLLRFYPWYVLACCSMYAAYLICQNDAMMNLKQFILSCCGLSSIIGPAPITLWYMSMLMFFYFITPVFLWQEKWMVRSLLFIFFEILFIAGVYVLNTDYRVSLYFPFYIISFFIKEKQRQIILRPDFHRGGYLLCMISLIVSLLFVNKILWPYKLIIAVLGVASIILISYYISRNRFFCKAFSLISIASLIAYLFHSQYYWCAELILGKLNFALAYLVIFPSLVLLSYFSQLSYNLLLKKQV